MAHRCQRPRVSSQCLVVSAALLSTSVGMLCGWYLFTESMRTLERTVGFQSMADVHGVANALSERDAEIRLVTDTLSEMVSATDARLQPVFATAFDKVRAVAQGAYAVLRAGLRANGISHLEFQIGRTDLNFTVSPHEVVYAGAGHVHCGAEYADAGGIWDPSDDLSSASLQSSTLGGVKSPVIRGMKLQDPEVWCENFTFLPQFTIFSQDELPLRSEPYIEGGLDEFRLLLVQKVHSPLFEGMHGVLIARVNVSHWSEILRGMRTTSGVEIIAVSDHSANSTTMRCVDNDALATRLIPVLMSCAMIKGISPTCADHEEVWTIARSMGYDNATLEATRRACAKTCGCSAAANTTETGLGSLVVLASSTGSLHLDDCGDSALLGSAACTPELRHFPVAHHALENAGGQEVFDSGDIGVGKYYYRVAKVDLGELFGKVVLIWTLSTESIEGDVMQALIVFICFVSALFVLQTAVAMLQICLLSRPLNSLARRMHDVETMQLENAVDVPTGSCLTEIGLLDAAFKKMLSALWEYRSYLPHGALLGTLHAQPDSSSSDSDDSSADDIVLSATPKQDERKGAGRLSCSVMPQDRRASNISDEARSRRSSRSSVMPQRTGTKTSDSPAGNRVQIAPGQGPPSSAPTEDLDVSIPALGPHLDLGQRSVSVFATNLSGFLAFVKHTQHSHAWVELHKRYLSMVSKQCSSRKGVVDVFMGDRIFVWFNALQRCTGHRTASVQCALACTKDLGRAVMEDVPVGVDIPTVHAGIGCGTALFGSLGTSELKRFVILGAVGTWAPLLERLATATKATCLCDHSVFRDAEDGFAFRLVDRVQFHKFKRSVFGSSVSEVRYEGPTTAVQNQEWMYQLQEKRAARASWDVWTLLNRAQELRWSGDVQGALRCTEQAMVQSEPEFELPKGELAAVEEKARELHYILKAELSTGVTEPTVLNDLHYATANREVEMGSVVLGRRRGSAHEGDDSAAASLPSPSTRGNSTGQVQDRKEGWCQQHSS